jgi:hypothetical protein
MNKYSPKIKKVQRCSITLNGSARATRRPDLVRLYIGKDNKNSRGRS